MTNSGTRLGNRLHRTGPLTRRQLFETSLQVRKALATRINFVPAKRVAQKRKAGHSIVNALRLRGMLRRDARRLLTMLNRKKRCLVLLVH